MTNCNLLPRRSFLGLAVAALAGCSKVDTSAPSVPQDAASASPAGFPNQRLGKVPALPDVAVNPPDIYPLNQPAPPPLKPYDPSSDDPELQLRSRLYNHHALVFQAGRTLFTGPRMQQSLQIHLSFVDRLGEIPLARRRDLHALETASKTSFNQKDLAVSLESILSMDEVKRLRSHFEISFLHTFAVLLGTSVTTPNEALLKAISTASEQSEWRRSALAWLTSATKSEEVERHIAMNALPYVLSNIGYEPEKVMPSKDLLFKRADALAFARVHIATKDMTDRDVYAVIQNFQLTGAAQAYTSFMEAYRIQSNGFLIAFHDNLAELLSRR